MKLNPSTIVVSLLGASSLLTAQVDFSIRGRNVQIHSFASQGFAYSNQNNYLTMKTSDGSFAMTDGGANASMQITDNLRVGAQFYIRNIGNLGNFRPQVDWALADYKFASWLGIRAGKVKTTLGLYNDTQDLEFLHTWAILPQSAYPLDLRATTIAHIGGDLYGAISLKRLGTISYTAYAGGRQDDIHGGYRYGLASSGTDGATTTGHQIGGDVRLNNLVLKGLTVGTSFMRAPGGATATRRISPTMSLPVGIDSSGRTLVNYAEFKTDRLTLAGEYRREILSGSSKAGPLAPTRFNLDSRGWWASAAFRIDKRLELGTYHSRYYPNWGTAWKSNPANHMFDQVVAARFDLNSHWDLKIEQHFIDGYGSPISFRGFYPQDNPRGMKPETKMFVVRTGWNF